MIDYLLIEMINSWIKLYFVRCTLVGLYNEASQKINLTPNKVIKQNLFLFSFDQESYPEANIWEVPCKQWQKQKLHETFSGNTDNVHNNPRLHGTGIGFKDIKGDKTIKSCQQAKLILLCL